MREQTSLSSLGERKFFRLLLLLLFALAEFGELFQFPLLAQKQKRYPSQPALIWQQTPFQMGKGGLPQNYLGHSPIDVLSALLDRSRPMEKGEFETTEAYRKRIQQVRQKPILGSTTISDLLAFSVIPDEETVRLLYNADTQTFSVSIKPESSPNYQGPSLNLFSDSRQVGSFIGRNAFNRSTRVTVRRNTSLRMACLNYFFEGMFLDSRFLEKCSVSVPIPLNVAKETKSRLRVLLIGNTIPVSGVYARSFSEVIEATLQEPVQNRNFEYLFYFVIRDVWVFDFGTGEVFSRFSEDQRFLEAARAEKKRTLDEAPTLPISPRDLGSTPTENRRSEGRESASGGTNGSQDIRARIVFLPKPKYTEEARAAKINGKVILSVEILPDGSAGRIAVIRSLGYGLDEAAVNVAKLGRFVPAYSKGVPTSSTLKIEVAFNVY